MAQLTNLSQNKVFLKDLRIADRLWSRMKGLLGTQELHSEQGLWIHHCNSIHTFFMSYAIDCVFVDAKLKIKALRKNVRPGQLVWPIRGAKSVIEMKAGQIEKLGLQIGDELYVGH